ncbi:MAG TPA: arsenate reductase family protein [Acidimicrobiales bacterium]|nr:arsenate reductase family protein [Acidimicrobiales bacterium]
MSDQLTAIIWHNRNCSKSRGACDLLSVRGVDFETRDYIKHPPSRAELESVLTMLGDPDPKSIVRLGEEQAKDLGLKDASRDEILDALVENPKLIERPIVISGDGKAIVGRPPELVLDLFD